MGIGVPRWGREMGIGVPRWGKEMGIGVGNQVLGQVNCLPQYAVACPNASLRPAPMAMAFAVGPGPRLAVILRVRCAVGAVDGLGAHRMTKNCAFAAWPGVTRASRPHRKGRGPPGAPVAPRALTPAPRR